MDHDFLRSLCLAHGELAGEERERAEAHLEDCPACRDLLSVLLKMEAQARALGELPRNPSHPLYRLRAGESDAEARCLAELKLRLDEEIGLGGRR